MGKKDIGIFEGLWNDFIGEDNSSKGKQNPQDDYSTGEFIQDMFDVTVKGGKMLFSAANKAFDFYCESIVFIVEAFVDLFTLKEEVKQKCPQALKMEILRRKKNAVKVGIYDDISSTIPNEVIKIESNEGFSNDIKEGESYLLYN